MCAICLSACSGGLSAIEAPSETRKASVMLTGTLSLRGAQIEAWWGLRVKEGKLWRLAPTTDVIKEQLSRLNNQVIQIEGYPLEGAAVGTSQSAFPVFQVTKVL